MEGELRQLYNRVYREGEETFFSKFIDGVNVSETDAVVLSATDWEGKTVLDVGCGTGTTAYLIAKAGAASVVGIDYAEAAIVRAQERYSAENLSYCCMSLEEWDKPMNVIISLGTLEHMPRPRDALLKMGSLTPWDGEIILTCPCFLNIRGFVWMTLQTLLAVPMSLTDIHFISPFDIEKWVEGTPLRLVSVRTFDCSRGNGFLMLTDLRKRLTNALRDAGLDNSRVESFVRWLEQVVHYWERRMHRPHLDGATALYVIQKSVQ